MAPKIDTSSWQPQQKQLWKSLPDQVRTEVSQKGPEKAKAWVDQELGRQIDLRGTVGAGKMTGRGDKLRGPGVQTEAPKGDPSLASNLMSMLRNPMATAAPQALAGAGEGGGGTVEARQSSNLDPYVGQGPSLPGKPIRETDGGGYDLSGLAELDQFDTDPTTLGDSARCSANSTVAGLMVRGKDALKQGVDNTRQEIEQRITASDDPDAARDAFSHELAVLDSVGQAIDSGNLTTNDMNSFADVLYQVHDSNKGDNIMNYEDIAKMQESVGLLSPGTVETMTNANMSAEDTLSDPDGVQVGTARFTYDNNRQEVADHNNDSFDPQAFGEASARVASETFGMIADGEQATIGVHEGAGTGKPNHIILAGRTAEGEMYVYNPIGDPNYFTGQDALDHLADRVGVNYGQGTHRNANDPSQGTEYPLQAAVTFMGIKGQSD